MTAHNLETLCHGCDAVLGQDRYCAACEEVMPVYLWERGRPAVYIMQESRIARLLRSAQTKGPA